MMYARMVDRSKVHEAVESALDNASANGVPLGYLTVDELVIDLQTYDADLAHADPDDIRHAINDYRERDTR